MRVRSRRGLPILRKLIPLTVGAVHFAASCRRCKHPALPSPYLRVGAFCLRGSAVDQGSPKLPDSGAALQWSPRAAAVQKNRKANRESTIDVDVVMRDQVLASLKPIKEQQRALELFLKDEGLRIDAYAGTGKTTTLQLLAASSPKRALYLAFNRSIASAAQGRFPARVVCATSHSIAFRGVKRAFAYPEWKLTGSLSPNLIIEAFRMPEAISFANGLTLPRLSYTAVLLASVKRFLQSSDEQPGIRHIPRQGALTGLSDDGFGQFAAQCLTHVTAVWSGMCRKNDGLPLGHDGYLKLWALSKPHAQTDYVMVDEAQDLNPVLLNVLKGLDCPIVYVGDPYQQIYEWRGAVNAMEAVSTRHRVLLSQSFRFGPEIAAAATIVLRRLGARSPLRAWPDVVSHVGRVRPDVILARSNAGVMGNVLQCLERNMRCAVLGGTRELKRLLLDVQRIKQGAAASVPELVGFGTWKDVMAFSQQPEGDYLRSLVSLVQEHGEDRMLSALDRCEDQEEAAGILCSTAHRAKGREWNYVRLDSDFESGFLRAARVPAYNEDHARSSFEAEARLLYMAMTRARLAVHLPRDIQKRFGLRNTTAEILGASRAEEIQVRPGEQNDSHHQSREVVSPYHSPRAADSKEMAALKRIFR